MNRVPNINPNPSTGKDDGKVPTSFTNADDNCFGICKFAIQDIIEDPIKAKLENFTPNNRVLAALIIVS